MYTADIKKIERHFVPKDFVVTDWQSIEPFFQNLNDRNIDTKEALEQWLKDMSELEAVVSEDACWRQIKMTCDTENKQLEDAFNFFCLEIQPKIQPYTDLLNKKLVNSSLINELDKEKYFTYLRSMRKSIELFRQENISLQAELSVLQQHYGMITGKMTVTVNGKEYTLQQAGKFLQSHDRDLREDVYRKINERRLQDKETLNNLYNQLIEKRHQLAINAGFENYRDYRFKELGRFDYTKEDCFQFHEAVKQYALPLVNIIYQKKKEKLSLDNLRPWDVEAEPEGTQALHPFETGSELINKSIECFTKLRPFFGDCLKKMNEIKHFDLESRKGKAPGGYNCPLAESGAPFIFMNASGQMHDLTTMVHEGGHAVHSFLSHPLELTGFKEYPMEIAEVASMAMELFSMDYWNDFFTSNEELKRAKEQQLERVITIFPWIAIIDKFQHWVYENPKHTAEERTAAWMSITDEFKDSIIDYSGLDEYRRNGWQRQLHLFEVPFYYIEYGIAQLGAIGMWKQYKENKEQALDNYCNALSLGGTKTLPELYNTAGLKFDFSPATIKTLMDFVKNEMDKI
ncbi:M3 family oligoendopeptidase [Ferruginibacter albus]|uniref:M3 family oligoendopeptidase n=1 Tax=Ferruginibacter albus TaxID=2875540 RepID=UPI001CC3E577|nr:M3 family oligoendopeptidase [Ferruginibacter albus]UAY51948.1 M3 family oligoendopeptidase [Ferruginibacter albus]